MPDLSILHQMIKDTAKLPLVDKHNRKYVTLTEPQYPSSSVTISGMPHDAIIIKTDTFKSPDTIFAGSHGECRCGDYILVANTGNKKVILCIEMKATKGSEKEIIQQLKGLQCFVVYCQKIGEQFWNQREFLKTYKFRFISIAHTSIPKRKTRVVRQAEPHDRPDRMMKIDWPHHLEFNCLAGGN
jgi:hypothetical protein